MVISYGDDDDEGDKEVILVNTLEVAEGMKISQLDWNSTGHIKTPFKIHLCNFRSKLTSEK